ncbi:ATP-dependent RNA helicase HrpA [Tahibacter amnicola]|uniref:ATP-dependent RNA helicase HrpA n=1 Tax=Tahibacter amnicola TaxID=2976241 RepID=A0ABY6BF19_9GAMM|nr:ATP-dependent RNA helicase HrpA [Tahibacter amnicola]UXI67211.1 ATP-dependent RNA helicase HrpA [Tahibacter amnicola]
MSDLKTLRAQIDGTMTRDFGRLLGRWRRQSEAGDKATPEQLAALAADIARSRQQRAARAARVPAIRIDESLPIAAKSEEIVELIRRHQVVVLAGETGSGKTTQLPKLCLAAGRGVAGMIGCTQPRRIAARSVARRVAQELENQVGDLVGFQVRFNDQVSDESLVKFMTDGILLAETQSDGWLNAYDTIILDEAHERSLNIDFLLGYLKRLLKKRRDLKLIVTSATIDTARFAAHFDTAPVVNVEGRSYPVEVRWRPPPERGESSLTDQIVAAVDEITQDDPRGDVLLFLPGEREIRDAHLALARRKYRATEVLPLYARLSANDQDRVFKPGAERRIVLATNVAETSLTVPRIRYVIDTGTARVKRYSPRSQLERLHIEPVSQAAAEQRKGRCGRVGPGICYRLYSEADFSQRARYTDPEILRSSLAGVILRMLSLKLGDVAEFPFVEAPPERAIGDGYRRLAELGAIDERKRLTPVGRALAQIPVDVALARMLYEAHERGALRELLILAAFLSIQDPRERPADARQAADQAHAEFVDPKSDFVTVLRLWQAHAQAHEDLSQSKLRDWCQARFLSYLRMREWRELHRQLLLITDEMGWRDDVPVLAEAPVARSPAPRTPRRGEVPRDVAVPTSAAGGALLDAVAYQSVHQCLLAGWPTQVGHRDERGTYRSTRERRFQIFPGSGLAKAPPPWLLAGQVLDLQKVYGMLCARIEPEWVETLAAHLVKRSWRDVHWSAKRGAVMAYEQVTLFGLTLVEKRLVQFGAQDPEQAHEVFVNQALARCELDAKADFVRANARVLAEARELEAKQRRSGLLKDESVLAAWFAGKMPTDISTTAALDAWYRRATPAEQAALRWSLDDVLGSVPGIAARDFPARLTFGGHKLRVEYRFLPGDPADGVSLQLPLAFVNAVSAAQCEWLVPGLLPEKVAELIRGLPKALRRNFVPAPDFARAFAEATPPSDQPLAVALAAYLKRVTGVEVTSADFDGIALPPHLSMHLRVYDDNGRTLAEGRDLALIQSNWSGAARAAFSRVADAELTREDVAGFDFGEIPATLLSDGGLTAFPALVDLGDSVALRVFERRDEALQSHRGGVVRLLRRALADRIKQARRKLPINHALALKYAGIASVDSLREDLVEAALRELLSQRDLDIRRREDFQQVEAELGRALFAQATAWLRLVEDVLTAYAEAGPLLTPPLMGYGRANYDDLREQLAAMIYPGFVSQTPKSRLIHLPRYLKAMRLRAERLREDATRDQARMLAVQGYWRDYLKLRASGQADAERLDELRWLIEELRVSLFAQELKTPEPVSPKRLQKAVEALGGR